MVAFRTRAAVLLAILMAAAAAPAVAQMDMLPQIFRDLPPELQEGIPEQMTFYEYRALNRNVDFFTMFMSIFVPGYGLFQVERPELAWGVVGARLAGYGLMTGAVALQWNDFADLFEEQQLAEEDFQRVLVNGFIFGGGVVVSGLSWATDVMLAYHIAKQEKDLVQYTYGLRSAITGGIRGGGGPQADASYLRRLLAQESEPRLVDQLLVRLPAYAASYPDEPFAGEALYYAGMLHAERGDDANALRYALRSAYLHPRGARTDAAMRLGARLVERNRPWNVTYDQAVELASLPVAEGPDARFLAAVLWLHRAGPRDLQQAALAEVRAFLRQFGDGPDGAGRYLNDGLSLAADILIELGRPQEAAGYLAAIALQGPGVDGWAAHTLRLAELYLAPLADGGRARMLLRAIEEEEPGTREAERARELLGDLRE